MAKPTGNPNGRPTKLTPEVESKALEYLNGGYEKAGHAIPSVVGLAKELNLNKTTLYEWAKKEDSEFSNTLAQCKTNQEFALLNGGLKGDFNPMITKLALANHGYSDKQETQHSGSIASLPDDKEGLERVLREAQQQLVDAQED